MTSRLLNAPKRRAPAPGRAARPRVRIRPLRASDGAGYVAFVRGLSHETLRNRLLGGGLAVTAEALDRMLRVDQVRHVALAATARVDGEVRIIGVARYALESASERGELAVTVADEWQGMGIGCLLIRRLVQHARKSGVAELYGDSFATNTGMVVLMRRAGFTLGRTPGDAQLTRGTLRFAPPRRLDA
jgi:GNAT superfamily N-acetyltransferase